MAAAKSSDDFESHSLWALNKPILSLKVFGYSNKTIGAVAGLSSNLSVDQLTIVLYQSIETMADIPKDDLLLFGACCCCFSAFYTDVPACIGCSSKSECLCLDHESCCKLNTKTYGPSCDLNKEGNICKLSLICCYYALKVPTTLCKGKSQCCCLASQGALPPDADIPIMLAYLCVVCYPKFGVCKKVSEMK